MLFNKTMIGSGAIALSLLAGSAQASILNGTLNIGGNVTISAAGGGSIAFNLLPGSLTQTFNVNTSFGSFAPETGGTGTETVTLSAAAEPINVILTPPIANFLTFASDPNLSFTLTEVLGGVFSPLTCGGTPAPGQTCSPAGTPFNLSNGSGTASASFDIVGFFVTANDGVQTPARGEFSASFTSSFFQDLLAGIATTPQVIPYGAQFVTTAVPEPVYGLLTGVFGAMLMALGGTMRRRIERK